MNNFLDKLKDSASLTITENGAYAYDSTNNAMLDAFGSIGAMRKSSDDTIINMYRLAFIENPELATKYLFYLRDIRGGQGERNSFRVLAKFMAHYKPEVIINNLDNFLYYGRGDDLLCLLGTPVEKEMVSYINDKLYEDMKCVQENRTQDISLLAKWLPSENATSASTIRAAKILRNLLNLSSKQYRKMLSTLRKAIHIVESDMSNNDWDSIEYDKLPAKASMIYSDAFYKHSQDKYLDYLKALAVGNAKVNASSLFPVDIISKIIGMGDSWTLPIISHKDECLYDAMWKALPNYFEDTEETGLCVVDVSGSMLGTPMNVAVSLGLYCADKANGPFHNHFITFSDNPHLVEVKGNTIVEKAQSTVKADWGMGTDIEAIFNLILNVALENNLPQEELPTKLYIISDMQFNLAIHGYGVRKNTTSIMKFIESKFNAYGYNMPALVYWNVRASQCGMFQDKEHGNCCMVSGYSASLFKSVINGTEYEEEIMKDGTTISKQKLDPIHVMETTLNNERYDRVWVPS